MKKNMGSADSAIRILIAVIVFLLIFMGKVTGTLAIVLGVVAGIFVLTSFVRVCPLYLPFGISTNKNNKQQ